MKRIARRERPLHAAGALDFGHVAVQRRAGGHHGEAVHDDRLTQAGRHRRLDLGGLGRERRDQRQRQRGARRARSHRGRRGFGGSAGRGAAAGAAFDAAGGAGRLALGVPATDGRGLTRRRSAGAGAAGAGAAGGGASVGGWLRGARRSGRSLRVLRSFVCCSPPHPIARAVLSRAADIRCLVIVSPPRTEWSSRIGPYESRVNVSRFAQRTSSGLDSSGRNCTVQGPRNWTLPMLILSERLSI